MMVGGDGLLLLRGIALTYNNVVEYAFFIDGNGNRQRPEFIIEWEGSPEAYAFSYPYLLAFEPNFIEICDIVTVSYVWLHPQ